MGGPACSQRPFGCSPSPTTSAPREKGVRVGAHWFGVPPPRQGDMGDPEQVLCLPHGNCSPPMPRLGPSELLSLWGHGWGLVSSYHLLGQGTGTGRAGCPLRGAAAQMWGCLCTDAPAHMDVSARASMWAHARACELTRVHARTFARVRACAHTRVAMSPQHTPRGTTTHTLRNTGPHAGLWQGDTRSARARGSLLCWLAGSRDRGGLGEGRGMHHSPAFNWLSSK